MIGVVLLIAAFATQISADENKVTCIRELTKAHNIYCYGIEGVPAEMDIPPQLPEGGSSVMAVLKLPDRFGYRSQRMKLARQKSQRLIEACCIQSCSMSDLLEHC